MHSLSFLLFGPYVNRKQKALVWITGLVFSFTILFYAYNMQLGWVWWQYVVAGVVSFDIPAGAAANSLRPVKKYWQQMRKSRKHPWKKLMANPMVFASLHISYIAIMGFSFWENPTKFTIVMSAVLLFAVTFVTHLPKSMSHAGGISMIGLAMLVNIPFHPPSALWWFMPLMVAKVVSGFSTP